ncbi:MAG TPA: cytidylate kinase family protein, partial [candidate division Zixibacteria bacterium]|nr:cytidylate kinase family protein [candidate division Zixibacteria bacterium]
MATSIEALVDRQIRRGQFAERAGRERQSTAAPPRPVHRVITISRQAGAGGRRLADRIAAHLNFEVIDRQIIDMLVQSTGARERLIRSLDHDVVSGIDLWVQGVITGRYVDRDEYAQWLVKIITALAEHGQAVIIGRAASAILRQRGGLHIRLVAP